MIKNFKRAKQLLILSALFLLFALPSTADADKVSCWRTDDWEMQLQSTGRDTSIMLLHYIGKKPCLNTGQLYRNKGRLSEGNGFCSRFNSREFYAHEVDQDRIDVIIKGNRSDQDILLPFMFQGTKELLDTYDMYYSPTPCFHGSNPY